jgi:deoxyribose-phosphate aldolase
MPLATLEALAKLIDHPLVKPELTDEQVIEGLELAKRYRIASASVRPCGLCSPARSNAPGRSAERSLDSCPCRNERVSAP